MKGRQIADGQKKESVRLYRLGYSYAEVELKTGVSRASLTAIIAERAKNDPDVLDVHDLAASLRKRNKTPDELFRSLAIEEMFEDAGCTVEDLLDKVRPLLQQYGARLVEICAQAEDYARTVEATGLTLPQLQAEHRHLDKKRSALQKEVEASQAALGGLEASIEESKSGLDHVEDLERIQAYLSSIDAPSRQAAGIIEKSVGLWRGLSSKEMDAVASELKRSGIEGPDAPRRMAALVARYGSLENAVNEEQKILEGLDLQKAKMVRKASALEEKAGDLDDRKRRLKAQVKVAGRQFSQIKKDANTLAARNERRERASRAECENRKLETERWCRQRVAEAEDRAQEMTRTLGATRLENGRMRSTITGSVALMGFLFQKRPVTVRQLLQLYRGPSNGDILVPEEVRQAFIEGLEQLAAQESVNRIRSYSASEKSLHVRVDALSAKVSLLQDEEQMLRDSVEVSKRRPGWEDLASKLLRNPVFLKALLEGSEYTYLVEAFTRMRPSLLSKVQRSVERAGEIIRTESERRSEREIDEMLMRHFQPVFPGFRRSLPTRVGQGLF